jgi:hypothetical protein
MTLPSWARPATAWSRKAPGPAEPGQHLAGVQQVEQIDEPGVLPLQHPDLQRLHEPADGQPEVVAHHDEALYPAPVALPQGLHQLRALVPAPGVQPLLELVEHQQHLLARFQELPLPQRRQGLNQALAARQTRHLSPQALQQADLRPLGGRLQVNRRHVPRQPRQQARLHQRRLAAPGRPVDQAHGERPVGVWLLDPCFPEP